MLKRFRNIIKTRKNNSWSRWANLYCCRRR